MKDLVPLILIGFFGFILYRMFQPTQAEKAKELRARQVPFPGQTFNKRDVQYVRWLQSILNSLIGAGLRVDGIYGPKTTEMVKTYQGMAGIPATGVMDSRTEQAIQKDVTELQVTY